MRQKNRTVEANLGFGDEIFLTESEWLTFRKRKPVRYIRKHHKETCFVCDRPAEPGNPLQHAHLIGFDMGIIDLGLTPDHLDSHFNIDSAHRQVCNKQAELTLTEAILFLREELGIIGLPHYLPQSTHLLFKNLKAA